MQNRDQRDSTDYAVEERLRKVEQAQAVHDAVCAERYKAILVGQGWTNKLVMFANSLLIIFLGVAAAGNPILDWIAGIIRR